MHLLVFKWHLKLFQLYGGNICYILTGWQTWIGLKELNWLVWWRRKLSKPSIFVGTMHWLVVVTKDLWSSMRSSCNQYIKWKLYLYRNTMNDEWVQNSRWQQKRKIHIPGNRNRIQYLSAHKSSVPLAQGTPKWSGSKVLRGAGLQNSFGLNNQI